MPLPEIDPLHRNKPLSYDPSRNKFILFDEIVSGREKIVPLDTLSDADLKKLVIERQLKGPDYTIRSISGEPLSRDDVVQAIERDDPFGQAMVEAEVAYLQDFLKEIAQNLAG
jgi:hypothetical protein